MRIAELPVPGETASVLAQRVQPDALFERALALRGTDEDRMFGLQVDGTWCLVSAAEPASRRVLTRMVAPAGSRPLAWVASAGPGPEHGDVELRLQVHAFSEELLLPDGLDIRVDDKVVAELARTKRLTGTATAAKACEWLRRHVAVEDGRSMLAIASFGSDRTLSLHGSDCSVDGIRGEDGVMDATRVRPLDRRIRGDRDGAAPPTLIRGEIRFVDGTQEVLRTQTAVSLDSIATRGDGYLRLWGDYNEIETRKTFERARAVGAAEYTRWRRVESGAWRFFIAPGSEPIAARFAQLDQDVAASEEVPPELVDPEADAASGVVREPFNGPLLAWTPQERPSMSARATTTTMPASRRRAASCT